MLNSLSFCLSVKLFISPSNPNKILAGYSILSCGFSPCIIVNINDTSFLTYRDYTEKSADTHVGIPIYLIRFPLFLLIFLFANLITVSPAWTSLCFLHFGDCFLSHVREVFNYYLFKYFLRLFFFSPSETLILWILVHLTLSQMSLNLSAFHSFLFILFRGSDFSPPLSSGSLIHPFTSLILLLIPSKYIFSFQLLCSSVLFFIFSNSLLKFSYNCSLWASILFCILESSLWSLCWTLFWVDCPYFCIT